MTFELSLELVVRNSRSTTLTRRFAHTIFVSLNHNILFIMALPVLLPATFDLERTDGKPIFTRSDILRRNSLAKFGLRDCFVKAIVLFPTNKILTKSQAYFE